MRLIRLYHTVRHLKWRQILGQLSRKGLSFRHAPSRWKRYKTPLFPGVAIKLDRQPLTANPGQNSQAHILDGRFEFLNQQVALKFPPEWIPPASTGKLWSYNLHYFDWIHTLPYQQAKKVTLDWIQKNPPEKGSLSWDPYPTSLRVLNWALYFFIRYDEETNRDKTVESQIWKSLAQQTEYLSKNLETHLLGNHILENATTLAFVGTLFNGETAKSWKNIGLKELSIQIPEQILPDGLHFELSPMYHLRAVYLLGLLEFLGTAELSALVTSHLVRSVSALEKVLHPDGDIALLNDSAFGIYHEPNILMHFAASVLATNSSENNHVQRVEVPQAPPQEPGPWSLSSAGYYGYRDDHKNYIICDAGPIGPDYIPGHAHADVFTYELSLKGCRVIVDTGNFEYIETRARSQSRSTRAHNTVEINGLNQCEMWGAFRVGRRVQPEQLQFDSSDSGFQLSASYRGVCKSQGNAIHRREFEVSLPFQIKISDQISADVPVEAKTYIHLSPECSIIHWGKQDTTIQYQKGFFSIRFQGSGQLSEATTNYFPKFGVALPRTTICYTTIRQQSKTAYTILPIEQPDTDQQAFAPDCSK